MARVSGGVPPVAPPEGSKRAGGFMTILQGIRPYDRSMLSRDIVAGVTLAALAIPEGVGDTKIAGTPRITGLYTILLPPMLFPGLGAPPPPRGGGGPPTPA